jgi:hypothetical protein
MSKFKVGDIVARPYHSWFQHFEILNVIRDNGKTYYHMYLTGSGEYVYEKESVVSEDDIECYFKIVNVADTVRGRDMKLKAEAMETARINVSEPKLGSKKSYYEKLRDEFVIKTMSEFRLRYPHELGGDEMLERVINTANAIVERLTQEQ